MTPTDDDVDADSVQNNTGTSDGPLIKLHINGLDLGLLPADRTFCAALPFSPHLYGLILESADECRGAVA